MIRYLNFTMEGQSWILEVTEVKTVPYVPLSRPFIERLIGTIWREFLDYAFFLTTRDLE